MQIMQYRGHPRNCNIMSKSSNTINLACKLLILRISIKSTTLIIAIVFSTLVNHIEPFRYYPARFSSRLWKHKKSNLIFTRVADDFGIKVLNNYHVDHSINVLQTKYDVSINQFGYNYCGLTTQWIIPKNTLVSPYLITSRLHSVCSNTCPYSTPTYPSYMDGSSLRV